jgi:hypothetical protein
MRMPLRARARRAGRSGPSQPRTVHPSLQTGRLHPCRVGTRRSGHARPAQGLATWDQLRRAVGSPHVPTWSSRIALPPAAAMVARTNPRTQTAPRGGPGRRAARPTRTDQHRATRGGAQECAATRSARSRPMARGHTPRQVTRPLPAQHHECDRCAPTRSRQVAVRGCSRAGIAAPIGGGARRDRPAVDSQRGRLPSRGSFGGFSGRSGPHTRLK